MTYEDPWNLAQSFGEYYFDEIFLIFVMVFVLDVCTYANSQSL